MPTSPPSISPTPTPTIQRNDRATFSDRVDARILWEEDSPAEFNALGTNVFDNATDSFNSATDAGNSEANAANSETVAASNANFKGSWSSLSGAANVPYSVEHSGETYMLLSDLADVTTKTPGVDSEWLVINKPLTRAETHAIALYF